jgi:hypothetical protein
MPTEEGKARHGRGRRGSRSRGGAEGEEGGGHKVRKFFLLAAIAGLVAGLMGVLQGPQGGFEEDEWQELPPPEGR